MLDLHCHILPGIDDGARDLADAVAMARQAERDGITAICATPHIRHDHEVRIAELPARLAARPGRIRENPTRGCAPPRHRRGLSPMANRTRPHSRTYAPATNMPAE